MQKKYRGRESLTEGIARDGFGGQRYRRAPWIGLLACCLTVAGALSSQGDAATVSGELTQLDLPQSEQSQSGGDDVLTVDKKAPSPLQETASDEPAVLAQEVDLCTLPADLRQPVREGSWSFAKTTPYTRNNELIVTAGEEPAIPFTFTVGAVGNSYKNTMIIDVLDPDYFSAPSPTDTAAVQQFIDSLNISGITRNYSLTGGSPSDSLTAQNFDIQICGQAEPYELRIKPKQFPVSSTENRPYQISLSLPAREIAGPSGKGAGRNLTLDNTAFMTGLGRTIVSEATAHVTTTTIPWSVSKFLQVFRLSSSQPTVPPNENSPDHDYVQSLFLGPASGFDPATGELSYKIDLAWRSIDGQPFDQQLIADVQDVLPDYLEWCGFQVGDWIGPGCGNSNSGGFWSTSIAYGNGNNSIASYNPGNHTVTLQAPTNQPVNTRTSVRFRVRLTEQARASLASGNLLISNTADTSMANVAITKTPGQYPISVLVAEANGTPIACSAGTDIGCDFRFELKRVSDGSTVRTGLRVGGSGLLVEPDGKPLFVDQTGHYDIVVSSTPTGFVPVDTDGITRVIVDKTGNSRLEIIYFQQGDVPQATLTLSKRLIDDYGANTEPSDFQLRFGLASGGPLTSAMPELVGGKYQTQPIAVTPGAVYQLSERLIHQGAAVDPTGYEVTWSCQAEGETLEVSPSGKTADFTVPSTGGQVTCEALNTVMPVVIEWSKIDGSTLNPLAGSVWQLAGPGFATPQEVTGCATTTPCGPGQFSIGSSERGLQWGQYTLHETHTPSGYIPRTEPTLINASGTNPFAREVNGTLVVRAVEGGKIANQRLLGDAHWSVTDPGGNPLDGATWTLLGPGEDSTQQVIVTKDAAIGNFHADQLQWGTYTLTQVDAPPGYIRSTEPISFTIDAQNTSPPRQLGAVVNVQIAPTALPQTGGTARDLFLIVGIFGTVAAVLAAINLQRRRYRRAIRKDL